VRLLLWWGSTSAVAWLILEGRESLVKLQLIWSEANYFQAEISYDEELNDFKLSYRQDFLATVRYKVGGKFSLRFASEKWFSDELGSKPRQINYFQDLPDLVEYSSISIFGEVFEVKISNFL